MHGLGIGLGGKRSSSTANRAINTSGTSSQASFARCPVSPSLYTKKAEKRTPCKIAYQDLQ
jgi:hypothetical protein